LSKARALSSCLLICGALLPLVARTAGVAVVAVDFGYSETPVAELNPDRIVSSFACLPETVWALLAAQKSEFPQKVNR